MDKDDADVGVIAQRLGYQLRRLDILAMERLHDELAKLGVAPGRATALVFIALNPGCDQSELARALGINRASTMAKVNSLVALGAVERRPGRDRRSNALHLTRFGEQLRQDIESVSAEHDADFFDVLPAGERAELHRLIVKARTLHNARNTDGNETRKPNLRRVK